MRWFGCLLICFSTVFGIGAQYGWPPSKKNAYAIVGADELGFYLPLADFELTRQKRSSDQIACLSYYQSLNDPERSFVFLYDPMDGPIEVSEFAMWCFAKGNFLDFPRFKEEAQVIWAGRYSGGKERNVECLVATIAYRDLCFVQCFFTHKSNGYALIASCKKEDAAAAEEWKQTFTDATLHLECFEPK